MNNWNQTMRSDERNDDKPPYSRVFVVCSKQLREEDLRPAFEGYGQIEDIHMPRDRSTGDSKGIAYIKYSKTSSAATAIQELHLKVLDNCNKPIKVMVASHRNDNHNTNEDKYKRLFIKIHKEATESEIRQHFSNFGSVESVRIQRDKLTEENRGFAYVHFKNFIHAAKALEECDRKYKPIFATPKEELKRNRNSLEGYVDHYQTSNSSLVKDSYYNDRYHLPRDDVYSKDGMTSLIKTKPDDYNTVSVTCSPQVPQRYIDKLFNIIPGMVQCKYIVEPFNAVCKATVTYETEKAAAYAVERLNNFEFPSGEIVSVKPDDNPLSKAASSLTNIVNSFKNAIETANPDLSQLADAIAQASSLIKAATSGRESNTECHESFCSVALPPAQPIVSGSSRVAQRCFLVFKPHPPPMSILRDAFCRFGDLIDVSTFPNKTFGFAKYASINSAQEAERVLNGATLCGIKLKVLKADEKPTKVDKDINEEESGVDSDIESKRMKLDD